MTAFIEREKLCTPADRILVAVSGGPDSVALVHLFQQLGYDTGIAHCNYGLRGAASDGDEAFVQDLAGQFGLPFYSISFPTREQAAKEGRSIQEVARDLRYGWLETVRQKEHFDWIATGHHADDSVETVLFHLAKGCGIRGMHGILPKQGFLIRPLLFAGKEEVLDLLQRGAIPFRTDRSNEELYYDRNKIRHGVVPVLQSINPDFGTTARRTIRHLREAELFFDYAIREWKGRAVKPYTDGLRISWKTLLESPAPPTLLYEILAPHGFTGAQLRTIFKNEQLQPGRRWYSSSHCLLSDREHLLLEPLSKNRIDRIPVEREDGELSLPEGILYFEFLSKPPTTFPDSNREAFLDGDRLQFPLLLRRWQAGDSFQPLGMNGQRKKLQDFFSDLKLSIFEKEKTWILESSGQIAWVVGRRIDESFKLSPDSTSCWHFWFE